MTVHRFKPDRSGLYCRECDLPEKSPRHNVPPPPKPEQPEEADLFADVATVPVLPYAGTSGWAGSETSRDRAEADDESGTTSHRQYATLDALDRAKGAGLTYRQLGALYGWHHGQASGVLSVLHKEGRIVRLAEVRERCKVYVMPAHVAERETEEPGGRTEARLRRVASGAWREGHDLACRATPCEHVDPYAD